MLGAQRMSLSWREMVPSARGIVEKNEMDRSEDAMHGAD